MLLFLASNPHGTTPLALSTECAEIQRELRMAPGRDDFDFQSRWAVSLDEMMRYLNELEPAIIHFSGHGAGAGAVTEDHQGPWQRDVQLAQGSGLILEDAGRMQPVAGPALALVIAAAAPSTRVVVLNACFSDTVAESLREVVDCVISMKGAIDDRAARSFAVGFYRALGNGRSVGNAVAQGVALLAAKQLPGEHLPVCRTRDGISADDLYLSRSGPHRP